MTEDRKPYMTDGREPDRLDQYVVEADADPKLTIMAMFWRERHRNPEFAIEVSERDLKGFEDCMKYLEVTPVIRVHRPAGLPAQEAIPAHGKRRAIAGRAAIPPKPYVIIQLVDKDGNSIKPVENNEADFEASRTGQIERQIRESAPQIAADLEAGLRSNTTSNSTIERAIQALRVMSRTNI